MQKQFLALVFSMFISMQLYSESIVVIGAGLAGLTTAYCLKKEGYEVQVFEARSRAGGRVCSVYFPEGYNELGGQNIFDGGTGESICSLARELKVPLITYNLKRDIKRYENNILRDWYNLFQEAPEPTEEKYRELSKLNNLNEVISNLVGKEDTPLRSLLEIRSLGYEGCDLDKLSMFYFDSFWSYYKINFYDSLRNTDRAFEFCTVKDGMSNLIKALCKSIDPCIHYNHPLTKLCRNKKGGFILHLGDKEISATKIILALPYSTLRDVQLEEGIFPHDQLEFIKTLQYGTNSKILMPTKGKTSQYCGSNRNCVMLHSNAIMWLYFGGSNGIFDAHTKECLQTELTKHIPSLKKLFPELMFDEEIIPVEFTDKPYVKAEHSVGISWIHEQYSKGSYSCLAPGQEIEYEKTQIDCCQKIRSLFRSIENSIFFAGEHTAFESSTMEGAVESGKRVARMVMYSLNHDR